MTNHPEDHSPATTIDDDEADRIVHKLATGYETPMGATLARLVEINQRMFDEFRPATTVENKGGE